MKARHPAIPASDGTVRILHGAALVLLDLNYLEHFAEGLGLARVLQPDLSRDGYP